MPFETSYPYAASLGFLQGTARVATLGNNPDVDTGTQPEDVWAGATLGVLNGIDHRFIPLPVSAVSMEVVSDSANDAAAGTGARTVVIGYLTSDYTAKSVVLALNGLTPVALPEPALRVNMLAVVTSGTRGNNNAGNISVRLAGGLGATYKYLTVGVGFERSSMFTVPKGSSFDLISMFFCINRTDTVDRAAIFSLCNQSSSGRLIKGIQLTCTTTVPYRHEADGCPLISYAATTDVWIRCEAVNNNNTDVTASLFGIQRNSGPFAEYYNRQI